MTRRRHFYLYLVRVKATGEFLGVFSVKHEARFWAQTKSRHSLEALQLSQMPDGIWDNKSERNIRWEFD
jgi:hypothetical protein